MGKVAHNRKNLAGQQFGKLTAVRIHSWYGRGTRKEARWFCECKCGKSKIVLLSNLTTGRTKSCGCMQGFHKYKNAGIKSIVSIMNSYRSGARARGHAFSLSVKQFIKLVLRICYYCKRKPSNPVNMYLNKDGTFRANRISRARAETATILVNGIDRRDNRFGYTRKNTVTACKQCNYAKHTSTEEEHKEWIKHIRNSGRNKS